MEGKIPDCNIKLDICCVMSCKLYNIRKFAMLIEIYFTIAKFAILRGIYFTIATFAKVRSQKQYSQLRYSQFNRVTNESCSECHQEKVVKECENVCVCERVSESESERVSERESQKTSTDS